MSILSNDSMTIYRDASNATIARMAKEGETREIGDYTSEDYFRLTHLRELLEALDALEITPTLDGGKLLIVAPMLNVWTNGDHGFLVDMEDAEDVGYALDVVTDEYAECEDPEGCDVCDYGAEDFGTIAEVPELANSHYAVAELWDIMSAVSDLLTSVDEDLEKDRPELFAKFVALGQFLAKH